MGIEERAKTAVEIYTTLEPKVLNNEIIAAEVQRVINLRKQKWVPLEDAQKLEAELVQLKSWFYCICKNPDYNKFGMDNMCARCMKPIEGHPLTPKTVAGEQTK